MFSDLPEIIIPASIAAITSIAITTVTLWVNSTSASKTRQRVLYGGAFKAVMGWKEMLYRIRRRRNKNTDSNYSLISRFHELQEEIDFNQGWISTESKWLGRSYSVFSSTVKKELEPLIRKAWQNPGQPPTSTNHQDDIHPDLRIAIENFTLDVRLHMSIWPWNKIRLAFRNRKVLRREKSDTSRRI